jgi:putative transcriptional regulator
MMVANTGTLLIAEPTLNDPSFSRSVVLICRHSKEDGTVGFALNEILDTTVAELIEDLQHHPITLHLGGPVQNDTIHYIHQYPEHFEDAVEVSEGIYWGGDFEKFKTLYKAGKLEDHKIKFFLGYSGWDAGQLEDEILEDSWILCKANKELVFETAPSKTWTACLTALGGKYELMIHYPTDEQLN